MLLRVRWLPGSHNVDRPEGSSDIAVLILSALVSVCISFVSPGHAMLAYLLNAIVPWLRRRAPTPIV